MPILKTHQENIDGIGEFVWRLPRTMRAEIQIAAEYSRITEGVERPTAWLSAMAEMMSVLKILTVQAPDGWDIDEMDPLDVDTYAKITEVFGALRDAEDRFRAERAGRGQADRPTTGGVGGSVVPEAVQPTG